MLVLLTSFHVPRGALRVLATVTARPASDPQGVLCCAVHVQVMYVTLHERQLMKSAMEMAVLTSIQHPNIVRVYACLTDLVEEAGEGGCELQ